MCWTIVLKNIQISHCVCLTQFAIPITTNSKTNLQVRTRPAGPMAIQLWTKNIKNLEIASYALCFCPNFKPFRSISYSFKDKDILHTNWVSSKFLTQDLEILSLNYQKAHLISIGNNVWKSYTLCWQRYALDKIMRCPPAVGHNNNPKPAGYNNHRPYTLVTCYTVKYWAP